ncbi:hypothetical protein CAC42_4118 [Sphaceloma murrayae]|uniref:RBR-type E3 ubiquitin transferase n=1 Tax=Sphaceloma murrayae TaxID=2082308 RepID=A0A2K1QKI2_9PEZI|nr:hypothetical protein CAC42_4118 [Sphaceloma murrayae]
MSIARTSKPDTTMDRDTQIAILEGQLEDLREIEARSKGKEREGDTSDKDLTIKAQREDLLRQITVLKDKRACRDRELALSLSRRQDVVLPRETIPVATLPTEDTDEETLTKLEMLHLDDKTGVSVPRYDEDEAEIGESSAMAARRSSLKAALTRECQACNEVVQVSDVARLPCHHEYCRECLAKLFTDAMQNEAYYPPRCCRKDVSLDKVRVFLPADLVEAFLAMVPELETKDRTYCHVPTCSTFLSPDSMLDQDHGTCGTCGATTCKLCKEAAHDGICPTDANSQALLAMAQDRKWQKCYQCKRFVELQFGCNHITCLCKAEFCYNCGLSWKTCVCSDFDERNLLARAQQMFDRIYFNTMGMVETATAYNRLQAEIHRIAEDLRANHDCNHAHWRYE